MDGLPPLQWPWRSEWVDDQQTYIYINEETNERTWDHPFRGGFGGGGFEQQDFQETVEYSDNRFGNDQFQSYSENTYTQDDFVDDRRGEFQGYDNQYVQEDVQENVYYNDDSRRNEFGEVGFGEERVYDDYQQDNFVDNSAQWAGEEVQKVEDIPHDIVQGIENIPEDVAGWVGNKVGDVERFDDNVDYSYDEGRAEARYEDYDRY